LHCVPIESEFDLNKYYIQVPIRVIVLTRKRLCLCDNLVIKDDEEFGFVVSNMVTSNDE
jgi:hypothetical protein